MSVVIRRCLERGSGIVYLQSNLKMRETGRSLSAVGARDLKEAAPSTRGPEWTDLWCASCSARSIAG
jgi:hypothetical protein